MKLDLPFEQRHLGETCARFFERESSPARVRAAEPLGFDPQLWRDLVNMGIPAMRVAEDQGGGGFGLLDATVVMEAAGRHLAPAPLAEAIVANRLLARIGTPLTRAWCDRALAGEAIVTLALHPVAERPRQMVPAGAIADGVLCLDGDAVVLILAGDRRPAPPNLGASPLASWSLREDGGERYVAAAGVGVAAEFAAAVEEWKLLTAAALAGLSEQALRMAAAYAAERVQFGQRIGVFQAVSHPLANAITDADGARLLVWSAIAAIVDGDIEAAAALSMAYWWAAHTASRAVATALHTFGGYGLTVEYDIQLYHRRGKAWGLLLGDPLDELERAGLRLWGGIGPAALPDAGPMPLDFHPGSDAERIAAEARACFEAYLTTPELRAKAHHSFEGHDPGLHRELGRLGLVQPSWPRRYGGRGATPYEAAAVLAVFDEYHWTTVPTAVTNMVGSAVMAFGAPELREAVLPAMAAGEVLCSLGYSEPSSGSDVFAVKTRAVRDGDGWRINGQKMFTSGAEIAKYVLLLTCTDPDAPKHKGITLFLVPLDAPGVEIQPIHTFQDERTNVTFYTDVQIPDSFRLGPVNGGMQVMAAALKQEHSGGTYVRIHRGLVDEAADWARRTARGGRPMIENRQILARLARAATHVRIADMLGRRSLWSAAVGIESRHFGPMAKLFGTEAFLGDAADLMDLAAPDTLVQARGGLGRIETGYRHATATTIYAGTSEIHRSLIAENALGLPRGRS